jgi:hypothetical protein
MMRRDREVTRGVTVLFPSDPAQRRLPDPIPASLYARPPRAAGTRVRTPATHAWRRWFSDFRRRLVILATDVWGKRRRLPILGSENPRVAAGGWVVILSLVVVAMILALLARASPPPSREHSARLSLPPVRTALPSPVAVTPSATHIPSSTPATIPVAAPRTTPGPTSAGVSFLNAPLSAQRGQTVTLRVQTTPNTDCSISIGYPSAPGLDSATSDAAGTVSWTWTVAKHVRPGSWPITVSCRTGTASTQITVS